MITSHKSKALKTQCFQGFLSGLGEGIRPSALRNPSVEKKIQLALVITTRKEYED